MTNRAVSVSDCLVLSRKTGKLHTDLTHYVWRSNGDDFMLRTDLLALRDEIDEILKRSKREDPHKYGDMG